MYQSKQKRLEGKLSSLAGQPRGRCSSRPSNPSCPSLNLLRVNSTGGYFSTAATLALQP
jgi:hypothetical protein